MTKLAMATILLQACHKTDMSLVHKLNTFRPRMSEAGKKLSTLESHLNITKERYTKDWAQVEPMLGLVPDSLRKGEYFKMIKDYKNIIPRRDTLEKQFAGTEKFFEAELRRFGDWENEVKAGGVSKTDVTRLLLTYNKNCDSVLAGCKSLSDELDHTLTTHNYVLRSLNEMIGRFENQDIQWQ